MSHAQPRSSYSDASRLAAQADGALRSANYDLAITAYQSLLKLTPNSAAAWSNLGSAWFAKEDFGRASSAFQNAARLKPANSDFAYNAALALIKRNDCATASPYLRISLESPAYLSRAEYLGGLCAFVSQRWSEAKDRMSKTIAAGNSSAEAEYMLSIAARRANDPLEARRAFDLLRTEHPDSSFLHELEGEALDRADQDSEAMRQIELAIQNSPVAPSLHAQLGLLLWKSQHFAEAEQAFKAELAIDKSSYSALHFLGDIAEKDNRLDAALKWYQKAVQIRPDLPEAQFSVGRIWEMKGDSGKALDAFLAAAPQMESDPSLHFWESKALRRLGRTEQADAEMAKVKELNETERNNLMRKLGNVTP